MSFTKVVNDELNRSFKHRSEDYRQSRIGGPGGLVEVITAALENKTHLIKVWVEIFTAFSEQEALHCAQRIYQRVGLPIPERLRPVDNAA